MSEPHPFVSKHRFDSSDCLEGEHKVRSYIAHRPGFGLPAIWVKLKKMMLQKYIIQTLNFTQHFLLPKEKKYRLKCKC